MIIIYVGNICNNDCIMCSVEGEVKDPIDYSILEKKLIDRANDTKSVHFTGGESTEHPRIIDLFKKVKELGYEDVSISTNGRNFADKKFTSNLVELGLNHASVTIHGPQKVHDEIIGKKGYEQAMEGLNNLVKAGVGIKLDSVLVEKNIDYIRDMWDEVYDLGVEFIGLADLIPHNKIKDFDELMINYKRKKDFFYENIDFFEKVKLFQAVNFPRCILPIKFPENFSNVTQYDKEVDWSFDGLSNKGGSERRKKINICKKCPYNKRCYGFRKENIKKFGEESIKEMLADDNFIKKSKLKSIRTKTTLN